MNKIQEQTGFNVSPKTLKRAFVWSVLISAIIYSHGVIARKVNCSAYPSQYAAQQAYNSDPVKYAKLDGNGNGIACEAN